NVPLVDVGRLGERPLIPPPQGTQQKHHHPGRFSFRSSLHRRFSSRNVVPEGDLWRNFTPGPPGFSVGARTAKRAATSGPSSKERPMLTSPSHRLAPWLLALALAAPAPAAALPAFDPGALLARLRGVLSALWAENGCEIVPDGKCGAVAQSSPPVTRVNGCQGDPDGVGCAPVLRDNGCELAAAH